MKTIINKMKEISAAQALPKFYKNDLEIDFQYLNDAKARGAVCDHWVWLIRDCGSLLVPCSVGASPVGLEFYIKEDASIKIFVIDTYQDRIDPIDSARAVALVNSSVCSKHNINYSTFKKVVDRGLSLGLWGLFTQPTNESLSEPRAAFQYFTEHKNKTMAAFCLAVNNTGKNGAAYV